jgi:hypothetical protein
LCHSSAWLMYDYRHIIPIKRASSWYSSRVLFIILSRIWGWWQPGGFMALQFWHTNMSPRMFAASTNDFSFYFVGRCSNGSIAWVIFFVIHVNPTWPEWAQEISEDILSSVFRVLNVGRVHGAEQYVKKRIKVSLFSMHCLYTFFEFSSPFFFAIHANSKLCMPTQGILFQSHSETSTCVLRFSHIWGLPPSHPLSLFALKQYSKHRHASSDQASTARTMDTNMI